MCCSTGSFRVQHWLCSEVNQLCPQASWFQKWQAAPLPGTVTSSSGQIGLEDTLISRDMGAMTQHLAWVWTNWALGLAKLFLWVRQIYTPQSFLVSVPPTWLHRGAKPMVGDRNAGVNLVCQDACAVLLQASSHLSIKVRSSVAGPHRFLFNPCGAKSE